MDRLSSLRAFQKVIEEGGFAAAARARDVVITMGCGDTCPVIAGKRYEDWQLRDPAGQPLEFVRAVRDDIKTLVDVLIETL